MPCITAGVITTTAVAQGFYLKIKNECLWNINIPDFVPSLY